MSMNGEPQERPPAPPLSMVAQSPLEASTMTQPGAVDDRGRPLVLLRFETVVGSICFPLVVEQAALLGELLQKSAATASTGLTIAQPGDVPPAPPYRPRHG